MTEIPEQYDDWTVDEVERHLEGASYSANELENVFAEYEKEHKDRKGVADAIEEELNDPHASAEDDEADEREREELETVTVTPSGSVRVSAAGIVFDGPDIRKEVEKTPRIERAIENGHLGVVE